MSRLLRGAMFCAAAILVVGALAGDLAARGGRGGGGRGGGGARRGGLAAGGSLGQSRARRDTGSPRYNGRAANGDFGRNPPRGEGEGNRQERLEGREERRDTRQEERTERREDWQEYAEDHYDEHDGHYHGGYYGSYYYEDYDDGDYAVDEPYYYTLPCSPVVMSRGGTVYYVCNPTWYIRGYMDGEVVYIIVPNPRE